MKQNEQSLVQSVERALDILNCFSTDRPELTIAELSTMLQLPKSTVFRLLHTLKVKQFIEQDPDTQQYRLGFRLYYLGNVYASNLDIREAAWPIMLELNRKTEETVNLNIVDRGERVCIEKVESPHSIRNFIRVGERNSLCYGASGKVLLAFLPEDEAMGIIDRELTDPEEKEKLLNELPVIRREKWCVTYGHRVEGALGTSSPIFDRSGKLIAGLSISGPIERMKPKLETLKNQLLNAAEELSRKMGYMGSYTSAED